MQKIKYVIPIIIISLFLQAKTVLADAFIIHLYYNPTSKILSFDKLSQQNITLDNNLSLSISGFTQESETAVGAYKLTLYDPTNAEIVSSQFDKQDGAFQLTMPYISTAASLKIFNTASGKELLSSDLLNFVTCNGNGTCELEKGETALNCIGDCANSHPQYSPATLGKLQENKGVITDPKTGSVLLKDPALIPAAPTSQPTPTPQPAQKSSIWTYMLLILAFLIIAITGWVIYKKLKNKDQ